MGKTRGNRLWLWPLLCAGLAFLGMGWLFGGHLFSRQAEEPPGDRFLRAVYVLQQFDNRTAAENVAIPRNVQLADATESLLHHPDRFFVLHSLALELSSLREVIPQASLFEAYARVELGETSTARALLMAYVVEYPYHARHYTLLCSLLDQLGEYGTLLSICAEWRAKDEACLPERLSYTWLALCRLGRFAEARDVMLRDGECLGWKRFLYASRAAKALGDTGEESALLKNAEACPDYLPSVAEALRRELFSMDFEER